MIKSLRYVFVYMLVFLWVYAAVSKLGAYDHFNIQLKTMPWINSYAHILVWLIPATELIIALWLLLPITKSIAVKLSLFVLSAFSVYIVLVLMYAPSIPCACGGIISQLTWTQHIFFNLFFIAVCIYLIKSNSFYIARKKAGLS